VSDRRDLVILLGLAWSWGLSIIVMWTWTTAYVSDADATRVTINTFGEKYPELLLFHVVVIPIMTVGLFLAVREAEPG